MGSATVTLAVQGRGKSATIVQSPDPVELIKGNEVPISVGTGFKGTGAISSIEFFSDNNGAKGTSEGSWLRSDPTRQPIGTKLMVTTDGTQNVKITDEEEFSGTTVQEKFHYSVTVSDTDGGHSADPVIINRKSL